MAWNPDTYNKFKSERFLPFYDLLGLVELKSGISALDLGCGTGELTRKLSDALPHSKILGIDASAEMLQDSKAFANDKLHFEQRSIEAQLESRATFDLIFSNAAIQWVQNHQELLPKIIAAINPGGQLAIQIPDQQNNLTNQILNQLADEAPFKTELLNWKRHSPVLNIDAYSKLLFENGSQSMTVFEKVYPLHLKDAEALFDWVSGTALLPYLERLPQDLKPQFINTFKKRLHLEFPVTPVFYPFRRILFEAKF
ncbi:trans-aconitate 2-methyltransferase [Flavobacterium noncentrifugens]|uniref:Trans-aconitate 2-methyltransferase n=1 Tax=Flavobacterium noncentrifugens TaxID=1128970 RepID=A0A1G9CDQ2_9FLAO|nr:methyltransferase domain-containing protein [Flavobacterium noncentrifugens]GEP52000.1 trans-aconitate 2-methyltransferase [Flavobacterium noncentrifugens]SDK49813.1 trans-aconitate 2-methyltransferase [Flavobacterium noncentrifugens]